MTIYIDTHGAAVVMDAERFEARRDLEDMHLASFTELSTEYVDGLHLESVEG